MRTLGCLTIIILITLFGLITMLPSGDSITQSRPTPVFGKIVKSLVEIPCGTLITSDMVALVSVSIDEIPSSPMLYVDQVVGKYATQWTPKDVPIFPSGVLDNPVEWCPRP